MKVKICGIRTYEDARTALDAGAWALGFIFHRPSPRFIEPEEAAGIVRRLPAGTPTIGVFVDRPLAEVQAVADATAIRGVQLHGGEDLAYARAVRVDLVIKALRVGPGFSARRVLDYPGCQVLLDAYREGLPGGTGTTADWSVAREASTLVPILLAGGLGPDNVAAAIEAVRPAGLDVSSGVEASPGVKDAVKVRRLFEEIRRALRDGDVGPPGA